LQGKEGGLSVTASMLLQCRNLISGPSDISPSPGLGKVDEITEEVVEEGESRGIEVGMWVMV